MPLLSPCHTYSIVGLPRPIFCALTEANWANRRLETPQSVFQKEGHTPIVSFVSLSRACNCVADNRKFG